MIGTIRTPHPTDGYDVVVRYRRFGGIVKILGISDAAGKDIWRQMTSANIQYFKSKIPLL